STPLRILCFFFAYCWMALPLALADSNQGLAIHEDFAVGKVLWVKNSALDTVLLKRTGIASMHQLVGVEVKEGALSGQRFSVNNEITDNPAYNVLVRPGTEVVLSVVSQPGKPPDVNISDYHRAPVLFWLAVAFLVVFLIFGGSHGLRSLAGL